MCRSLREHSRFIFPHSGWFSRGFRRLLFHGQQPSHSIRIYDTHARTWVRITDEWPGGPQGILLTADKMIHPLFTMQNRFCILWSQPLLFDFFKTNGLLLFNAMCFAALILLGCLAFPDQSDRLPFETIFWSITFWGLSAVPAYVFSLTPDLFNGTLLMAGLIPWVRHTRSNYPIGMLCLSSVIISIAASSRPPNALFLLLPVWSIVFGNLRPENDSKGKKCPGLDQLPVSADSFWFCALPALGLALSYLLAHGLTGQGFAYSGFRKRIVDHFPFESAGYTFLNTGNLMSTESTKFIFHLDTLFHNLYYFFMGRFAGLIPYFFPAFIALIIAIFTEKKSPESEKTHPSMSRGSALVSFNRSVLFPSHLHPIQLAWRVAVPWETGISSPGFRVFYPVAQTTVIENDRWNRWYYGVVHWNHRIESCYGLLELPGYSQASRNEGVPDGNYIARVLARG